MKTKLNWTKELFSDYRIFDNDKQIGFIKKKPFSQKSTAEINGEKYEFQERGFFSQETDIVDISENKIIGKIKYNFWRSKTFIEVNNENFTCESKNFWGTKWSIYNSKGTNILYHSSFTKGKIDTNEDDAVKILSGFYLHTYYIRLIIFLIVWLFFYIVVLR